MSEDTAVTMSDTVMEQMCCSVCKGYLSCGPIGILHDGSSVCGRCSSKEGIISRELALEAVLSNIAFPCTFKQNGCTERLLFGKTINHELTCVYRSFVCPSSLECAWKGAMSQIHDHFVTKHPALVIQEPNFKLDIEQGCNGSFVMVNNNIMSIVKYLYETKEHTLKYEIRFCNNSVTNVSYKLQLINDSDTECSVNLKTLNCSVYDNSFYDAPKTALDLNKFLSVLDNPNYIRVSIDLKVQHVNVNNIENDCIVNYELLKNLKCGVCQQYLILPLYELNNNTICCDCAQTDNNSKQSKPLNNPELVQLVNEISYPCRWHNCESVVKSNNLRNHELECHFRFYDCLLYQDGCKYGFRRTEAIDHYKQNHKAKYFEKEISFKFSFSDQKKYCFFTIMNNIKHFLTYRVFDGGLLISIYSSSSSVKNFSLNFKHDHCKLTSKLFEIKYSTLTLQRIRISELPPCFYRNGNDDLITVSLFV